jgi:hypothetical protein
MVSQLKLIKIISMCILLFICQSTYAQYETDYEIDSTYKFNETKGNEQVLRLKKGYILGDGVTFISSKGSLNINQTLQTVYGVNSQNKDLSALNSAFGINRARLNLFANIFDNRISLTGRLNFVSNFNSVTTGGRSFNTVLQEANIEYRPNRTHVFNFGLRADYVDSREIRIEGESIGFINRSAVSDAFDTIFDYGIRYKGNYKLGGKHLLRPFLSVTTGDSRSSLQKNFGGFKYGARLDYLPFDKFSRGGEYYMDDLYREATPKLVLGVVYSYNDGATSVKGTNGGRWLYGDVNQNVILPSYQKFGIDYLFKYNGWFSMGSYVSTNATAPTGVAGEFRLNGTFNPYPTTQTAEVTKNTVLSRLNLGSGANVQAGYLFYSNWSVAARYSTLKEDLVTASFANQNKYYGFVTTKYLAEHNLKIQLEIGYDENKSILRTATQAGNLHSQLQFTIQL